MELNRTTRYSLMEKYKTKGGSWDLTCKILILRESYDGGWMVSVVGGLGVPNIYFVSTGRENQSGCLGVFVIGIIISH